MKTAIIKRLNETYSQVLCEPEIARALYDEFTVDVHASKFAKRSIAGWDGLIRFFRTFNNSIYTGLIPKVIQFCKNNGIDIQYQDDIDLLKPECCFSVNDVNEIIQKLQLCNNEGLQIEPMEHQYAALYHTIRDTNRAVILSPTSSGKSLIIYVLTRFLIDILDKKVLLVVPNVSLIHQLYNDFCDYSKQTTSESYNWVKDTVQMVTGSSKEKRQQCILANWQAIYKMPTAYFSDFEAVIMDEVHSAKADSLKGIVERCVNAKYRYGFTGTLQDSVCHITTIEGLFGSVFKVTSTKELMNQGIVSSLLIKMVFLGYSTRSRLLSTTMEYSEEMKFVALNKNKNAFIVALAEKIQGNTIILVNLVEEHAKILYNMLIQYSKKKIYYISGNIKPEERERIRHEMEINNDCILVATYGTLSVGVNIKNIHNIIFGAAFKSRIRVLQSIGRELRLHENKTKAVLYDLVDDLSIYNGKKTKMNYLMKHASKRMLYYQDEGFDYQVLQKNIEKDIDENETIQNPLHKQ